MKTLKITPPVVRIHGTLTSRKSIIGRVQEITITVEPSHEDCRKLVVLEDHKFKGNPIQAELVLGERYVLEEPAK